MTDPRDVLTRAAAPPLLTVTYGDLPDQIADVWLPAGNPGNLHGVEGNSGTPGEAGARTVPLVVVVHGGFWRAEYDRRHTRPQCAGLAAAGYAVAAVEYRRVGAGGGWPATLDDVALALDTVPPLVARATASGPVEVDAARVVHVGHSAGAHLAVWAASRHRLPPGTRWAGPAGGLARPIRGASLAGGGPPASGIPTAGGPPTADGSPAAGGPPAGNSSPAAGGSPARDASPVGVVSLAGVLDLTAAADLDLDDGAAVAFLGGDPATRPERYAVADPVRLVPPDVPVVLLHGAEDRQVPPEFSRRYAAAAGRSVTLTELPGIEHFGLIDPESAAWPAVLAAVATLLEPRA